MTTNNLFLYYAKPLLSVLFSGIIGLTIHKIIFHFFISASTEENFIYPIYSLYGVFAILSLLIVAVLLKIKKKNMDTVGYAFLLLTSVKMVVAYIFLKPILETSNSKFEIEKISFFIVFIYFLAIETIVTIRILNNKL